MHLLLRPCIVFCSCFHSFDLKGRESFSSGQRGGEESKTVQLQPGPRASLKRIPHARRGDHAIVALLFSHTSRATSSTGFSVPHHCFTKTACLQVKITCVTHSHTDASFGLTVKIVGKKACIRAQRKSGTKPKRMFFFLSLIFVLGFDSGTTTQRPATTSSNCALTQLANCPWLLRRQGNQGI
jgi:hypothetical protein